MKPLSDKPVFHAVLLAFCGFSLWTTSDAITHYLHVYPAAQIALIAGIYSLSFMACFSPFLGGFRETFAKGKIKLQLARAVVLTGSTLATIYAFQHLPMTTVFPIVFLSPLVAKVLSLILNREKVPLALWFISLIGFIGVLLVIRPGLTPLETAEIVALCIPVCFATGFVLNRTIGDANQTKLSANLYCDLMLIAIFAVPVYLNFMPMSASDFLWAVVYSVIGGCGTILVSLGYARAPTAYVAPVHYTQIIWGVIWGALFFQEYPDVWTIAGSIIIVGAGLALVWKTREIT